MWFGNVGIWNPSPPKLRCDVSTNNWRLRGSSLLSQERSCLAEIAKGKHKSGSEAVKMHFQYTPKRLVSTHVEAYLGWLRIASLIILHSESTSDKQSFKYEVHF